MKTCVLLTPRRSLRRGLSLRACRWGFAAALSLLAVLTAWSDRAAAQSTSTGAPGGQQSSAGGATGNAGTKINLDSLMRQQIWGADQMGTEAHLKELVQSQSVVPLARNSSAGGAPSETVRPVPQRRGRTSDEEFDDAASSDGSAQDTPPELQGVQKPPFSNSAFSGKKD